MILIADSGSTKTHWCLAEQGVGIRQIVTAGANPYFQTIEEIIEELSVSLFPQIKEERLDAVYFYGAGCAFPEKNQILSQFLSEALHAPVEVYSDLMGAARALCGKYPGIACILGTGSNSCLYDGVEIVEHTPALGFILGDEGSGAVLGKQLVSDCLKKQLPEHIIEKFMEQYGLTTETILERVYRQPFPNRFLAVLSGFLLENITEPSLHALVYNGFKAFLQRNVKPYKGSDKYPIHFIGSIAHFYQAVLREAILSEDMLPGIIVQSPIEGLINYHV
ncbi:ATPase [Parabacteroides sp. 52]|uniref:ATPase n=1 Tax=unclassified Parabacteroides TaxID=2649774 RepID=UPI0013D4096B|nr:MULTISPECIES: ATPase [unclassified Parabacteroides]NDV55582.1 ATPase [Parabacteroides sp. 52]